jgi:hypothetical protein
MIPNPIIATFVVMVGAFVQIFVERLEGLYPIFLTG